MYHHGCYNSGALKNIHFTQVYNEDISIIEEAGYSLLFPFLNLNQAKML